MIIVVCRCGLRLRLLDAEPGRVGRCPSCRNEFRTPDRIPAEPSEPDLEAAADGASTAYVDFAAPRRAQRKRRANAPGNSTPEGLRKPPRDGLLPMPSTCEKSIAQTLLYPFWGAHGLFLLVVFPPLLWLATTISATLIILVINAGIMMKLLSTLVLIGVGSCTLLLYSFVLEFLASVLEGGAAGEVAHPRWPEFSTSALLSGLGRWAGIALLGGGVGGLPAVAYWIVCGDVDPFDTIILLDLAIPGVCYALMALLAVMMHRDVGAANPVTVVRALAALKFKFARICLLAVLSAGFLVVLIEICLRWSNPAGVALLFWMFWTAALYFGMVICRSLGLLHRKQMHILGWFRALPKLRS